MGVKLEAGYAITGFQWWDAGLKSISAGAGFAHFDRRTVGSFKLTAGCGMKNGKSHVRNCDSNRVESK